MIDTLTITLLFIFISALVVVIIRKIKKDKCLKDFKKNTVILEKRNGERIKGELQVASTGLEFVYSGPLQDESDFCMNSFLLYKSEFPKIQLLIRSLDDLSEKARIEREKELERTFHPTKFRRFLRKIANFFRTIKDSLLEIFNLVGNQLGKNTAFGMVLASQDKYINRIKNELFATGDNSFEPLLEKYIGYRVILELDRDDNDTKYNGILKRYTSEFIELIDVDYTNNSIDNDINLNRSSNNPAVKQGYTGKKISKKADLVIPRRYGVVRGLAEKIQL